MKEQVGILLLLGVLLGSCGGPKEIATKSATQLNTFTEGEISYKQQFRFKYLFLEAQRLKSVEDFAKASEALEQCLAIDSQNEVAHYELAQLYLQLKRNSEAIFHASKALELNSTNIWYYTLLARLYNEVNDYEGELRIYEGMVNLEPKNIEYQYFLARAYSRRGNYKKALSVYNKLEKQIGINEELTIKKEHLFIQMGDVDLAADELKKLIRSKPNEYRYRGMLAELYQANNRMNDAIEIYKDILKTHPSEPRSNMALAEFYRVNNDFDAALKYLNVCFEDAIFDPDIKFQILIKYFELAMQNPSYEEHLISLADKAIKAHPNHPTFYSIKGDLYFQKNEASKAFSYYGKSIDLGVTEFTIWSRYLILGLEIQDYESVIIRGEKAVELHPIQPTTYLFTGLAYMFTEQHKAAVPMFSKGLNYVVNNRTLKAEFYNYLAASEHELNNHKASDGYYEKSLALIPDNPLVLNNYSYYLSLRSKDLEKAQTMALKALNLNPNEPTYQDTYGWVLYKLEQYEEALVWIKKAVEGAERPSAEVLEHYGDVLYQLNQTEEAQNYWNRALELEKSERLLKKVTEGLIDE